MNVWHVETDENTNYKKECMTEQTPNEKVMTSLIALHCDAYCIANGYQRFGGTYYLHLQDRKGLRNM